METLEKILSSALLFSQETYGPRRIQEAAAEFCRWNPSLSPTLKTHVSLFTAWFLFDWTPDANDSDLPAGVQREDSPFQTWLQRPESQDMPIELLTAAQSLRGAQFSFFRFSPMATNSGTLKVRDLLTHEEFTSEARAEQAQHESILYGLTTRSDITREPRFIVLAPEVFAPEAESEILQLSQSWQETPIKPSDLRTYAVEIFDTYHLLRSRTDSPREPHPGMSGKD